MSTQSLALHLADVLDKGENFYFESSLHWDRNLAEAVGDAADELRRLHGVNAELVKLLESAMDLEKLLDIEAAQRTCATRRMSQRLGGVDGRGGIAVASDEAALLWQKLEAEKDELIQKNRAAIAKATGGEA